jgi:hypothetical protein
LPEGTEPYTAIAIGYPAEPGTGDDDLEERDNKTRERKAIDEFVIRGGL